MNWHCIAFNELTLNQLYDILQLRADVFVVEQNCVYADIDDKDRAGDTHHLMGYRNNVLVAYARLLPAKVSYDNVSIGRVVTHRDERGNGVGKLLITKAIERCNLLWPNQFIDIGAQAYLIEFYQRVGFQIISPVYIEDGIPHVDMQLGE